MSDEQDRVLALIKTDDGPEAASMRRSLLQTYDFAQQRRLVEMLVPRGEDSAGFFLQDNGTVTVKGVLDRPAADLRNLPSSPQ